MAEVYRARGPSHDRLFALKVMRPQLAVEPRFIDMFHREAKLATLLKNDCIVNTVEVGEVDGQHYIAMEYIGGCDLGEVLKRCSQTRRRIPVPIAVYVGARLAEGLHFAHTLTQAGRPLNIVNRDVSASNVRLSYDGAVKLLDFGIAQTLMKWTSEIGTLKGKFSYMSPEQIRGMPIDARSDVFSAGILLHEMLTTTKLFRGDTEFELRERVRNAEVAPPSTLNRRVSPDVDAICRRGRSIPDGGTTRQESRCPTSVLSLRPQGIADLHARAFFTRVHRRTMAARTRPRGNADRVVRRTAKLRKPAASSSAHHRTRGHPDRVIGRGRIFPS
jgi:serine/threonine protein kinase